MTSKLSQRIGFVLLVVFLASCAGKTTTIPTDTHPQSTQVPSRTPTSVPPAAPPIPTASIEPVQAFLEWSRDWRVAYENYDTNQICVIYGDGSGSLCRPYPSIYESYSGGSWSPDGNRLVFTNYMGLYIWNLEGGITPFREVTAISFQSPDWSPDGNYIAFASIELQRHVGQSYANDIFVSSLDGSTYRNITRYLTRKPDSNNPDWSPDGSKIVFDSRGTKPNPNYPADPWPYLPDDAEIYIVSPDGENPINLTDNEADDVAPIWSPDGREIAFLSNRDGKFNLYVMKADGTDARQVAYLNSEKCYGEINYYWLPDGQFILFNNLLINTITASITEIQFPFQGSTEKTWLMVSPISASVYPIPTPHCAYNWSRLYAGGSAVVSGGSNDPPNNVRSNPDGEVIAAIYPGTVVQVLEGPVCMDELIWWKVENASIPGNSGWTAEGDGQQYWLEPYHP